jgi:hypothetical protein
MRASLWVLSLAVTIGAVVTSCAEGGPGVTTSATSAGGGGSGTTSSTGGASTISSSTAPPPSHAVINEISAKGGDWVEIVNPGAASLDLSGFGLCDDVDPASGASCDEATAARFPKGTTLPPGGYLLVVGNEPADAGVGPHVECLPDGGPTTCFYATWKISSSSGETVHLLDAAGTPIDEVHYPADAVPSGQTWGRLPDGTGSFAANRPTPGAPNEAAP